VQDAVYQYKTDREPQFKPRNAPEPLLAFPGGALGITYVDRGSPLSLRTAAGSHGAFF